MRREFIMREFKSFSVDFVAYMLYLGKKYSEVRRVTDEKIAFIYYVEDADFSEYLKIQSDFYEGIVEVNFKQYFLDRKKVVATMSSMK